jgi:hypothetical protein
MKLALAIRSKPAASAPPGRGCHAVYPLRMSWKLAGIGIALLAACGGTAPSGVEQDERFMGRWFIEETVAHALYGASTYTLSADGTIELVWDAGIYGFPQGYVQSPDLAVRCFFGEHWTSRGSDVLVIEGDCDDETSREISLRFTSAAGQNAEGATVEIEAVGGEPGWLPPQWGWSFRKCASDEPCVGWSP